MEKILPYNSKSIWDYRDFWDALKLAFRLVPNIFLNNNIKIAFFLQYIRGDN